MMVVGLNNHEFGYPSVHEAVVFREPFSHDDFIEEFENLKPSNSGELEKEAIPDHIASANKMVIENTKAPEGAVCISVQEPAEADTPDYTRQLQFHQDELAQAEQRGFPPGQISYHVEKIRTLGRLVNNVIEVDFVKKERL